MKFEAKCNLKNFSTISQSDSVADKTFSGFVLLSLSSQSHLVYHKNDCLEQIENSFIKTRAEEEE